jgi:Ca2+-binding RTX toxin-like protein
MTTVTVQGSGSIQTINYTTSDALAQAQALAAVINVGFPATPVSSTAYTVAGGLNFPSTPGIVVNPSGGAAVSIIGAANAAASVVAGSAGTYLFTLGNTQAAIAGGNNTITLAANTTDTVVAGPGNDFAFNSGNGAVDVGSGTNTVIAALNAGASDSVLAYGTGDVIFVGAGAATVSEFGTAALISAIGTDQINDGGTNDTVVATGSANTIFGGSAGTYFLGAGLTAFISSGSANGSDTITSVGSGSETVFGGTQEVISAGNSKLEFIGNTGSTTINGGAGTDTVYTQNNSQVTYFGAAGTADLIAGNGNSTLNAFSATAGTGFVATGGSSTMIGGSGNDTFFAGSGSTQITGEGGTNQYAFINGEAGGSEVITDFKSGDLVVLIGYGANTEVANALATVKTAGGFTTMTLGDNTKITFIGTPTLNASNVTGF